jgi:pimeloyl-ACP methyl ester carboxylesterase
MPRRSLAGLLFLAPCVNLVGVASAPAATPPPSFVEVPQGRLWYEVAGQGSALVLIHDGLLPSETWENQVGPFARYLRVIRYDRRKYGRSESQTTDYSNIDDLRAVLDRLGIEQATLMGCSSGGALALDFALAHPKRVSALVLAGPIVSGFGFSQHFLERGLRNRLPMILSEDKTGAVKNWAEDPYITDPRNTAARARLAELLGRFPFAATGGDSGGRPPARPALRHLEEVRAPLLLITGASDIPDVHAHIGAIAAGVAHAERQLIPGAGHLSHLERPEEFNHRVLDFLAPSGYATQVLGELQAGPADTAAFDYDAKVPIDAQERGSETRGAARIVDLSYASPRGGRVPAYLVLPVKVPGPGLLFLHHGQGDRKTFLDEAGELAERGFVSLLVDAPDKRPGHDESGPWFEAKRDRAEIEQTVIDLRRGIDLLAARPEVDPARIGYVGYSLGATMGARLLGVEPRIRASVQVAGFPALTHTMGRGQRRAATSFRTIMSPEAAQSAYLGALAPLDGVRFLARRPNAPILLQFARSDEFISRLDAALFALASGARVVTTWHDGGHFDLGAGAAREERREFLVRELARR